jgi:hypothetical protein
MSVDPILSDPSDWNKALENYKKTGELAIPIKERWRSIARLSNETDLTNQEIADRVGLKTGQQVANEKVKMRRWEKETGSKLLHDSPNVNRVSREVELLDEAKREWKHDKAELLNLLHLIRDNNQRGLPFKGVQTRAGITKSKFDELWSELNEAGFQEDGTLWRGMEVPSTDESFNLRWEIEVMSYVTWLANHPDHLPDIDLNMDVVVKDLVTALCAIAIIQAREGNLSTLLSFKPYKIPQEHKNKENTETVLKFLKEWHKWLS